MGAAIPVRVGVELTLVVGSFGHLTPSKLGWILERPNLLYKMATGPEPKMASEA